MIANRIDWVMLWLKWPIALVAALSTPLWLWALIGIVKSILLAPLGMLPFAMGLTGFLFLWKSGFAKNLWGNWLIQFEHEVTHLIFAILTGHSVVGFRASVRKGSHVKFIGQGNWLITIAPYFFPTSAMVLWGFSWFMPIQFLPWSSVALGFALGYHLVSTLRETHTNQDDLKQLGWTFCWMFLPTANLIVLGGLVAYSFAGTLGLLEFFGKANEPLFWISESFFGQT